MTQYCRTGDVGLGICPAHKTPKSYVTVFNTGAGTVRAEGRSAVRVGDIGVASCGHPTIALTGALTSRIEGLPPHRIGDTGTNPGPYVATIAAATVKGT